MAQSIATVSTRSRKRKAQDFDTDDNGDVIMQDAPVSSYLTELINPAVSTATDRAKVAYTTAIGAFFKARDRLFSALIETRRRTDDGLIAKKIKNLPFRSDEASFKAKLGNTLPVDYLRTLPNDQFRWTDNVLAYLGPNNHDRVIDFLDDIYHRIKADDWLYFGNIHRAIDPRQLPTSVSDTLKTTGKHEPVTILLHNYMILNYGTNDFETFKESGNHVIKLLKLFGSTWSAIYEDRGRIPLFIQEGLKPYGPLKFPYKKYKTCPLVQKATILEVVRFLQFILDQRDAFNQNCPVDTIAGIIVDLDAIHKDEPAPSYVDWPGKHERVPGAYPEDKVHTELFDTVAMRDFEPVRGWEHNHPSPSKVVSIDDYDTPIRNAVRKNPIYYDHKGRAQAKKGALKKHMASGLAKKSARFKSQPYHFYIPSVNEPLRGKAFQSTASTTPATSPQPVTPNKQGGLYPHAPFITETMRRSGDADGAAANEAAAKEHQAKDDLPWHLMDGRVKKPFTKKSKTLDEFFAEDDDVLSLKSLGLKLPELSREKRDDFDTRKQLIEDAAHQTQREAEAEQKRKEDEERRVAEEKQRHADEERRRAEEELRIAEQKRIQEGDERLAQIGELRQPHNPIISALATEWVDKVQNTLRVRSNAELAKTPEGTALTRKDFETVVPEHQWLNDEIVNGTLLHLGNYVNQKAGIKNTRLQTAKVQVFNSFFGKRMFENGAEGTERMMRRAGIKKENFLDIETVLIPMCHHKHWTLMVIQPKHRHVLHLDSLNITGSVSADLEKKAIKWVQMVLEEKFIRSEWTTKTVLSPQQQNSDDCGVHTITNGICIGLGVRPEYSTMSMPLQRLRIAAVLLNGGFKGDLDLQGL